MTTPASNTPASNTSKTPAIPHWAGPADGPYMHINSIITYLREVREDTKHGPIGVYMDGVIAQFEKWKATTTARQLERVVAKLSAPDPAVIQEDLVALRNELEEGPG